MAQTWLLCGIPRSGNGLCCRLADGLPDTVALSQPYHPHCTFDGVRIGSLPREPRDASVRLGEFAAGERRKLWPVAEGETAEGWEPEAGDVLFLAGADWRYLAERGLGDRANPRINLVQAVRHAREDSDLYAFLSERAVRICISFEVARAISATGRVRGPVLTIPNGIDVAPFEPAEGASPAGFEDRPASVTLVGYKRPELARALSERLHREGIEHELPTGLLGRSAFLASLAGSRVAVCLPHAEEGFYLPALEAMASGALVVTLVIGWNRAIEGRTSRPLRAVSPFLALSEPRWAPGRKSCE